MKIVIAFSQTNMNFRLKFPVFQLFVVLLLALGKDGEAMHTDNKTVPMEHYMVHLLSKYIVTISYGQMKYYGQQDNCLGAIIEPNLILTAAHCLKRTINMPFFTSAGAKITAGSLNSLRGLSYIQERSSEYQLAHPEYKLNMPGHDLAVIALDHPLELNDKIQVIPLPLKPVTEDTNCSVVGWSALQENGVPGSDPIYVQVTIWPHSQCEMFDIYHTDATLCAHTISEEEVNLCSDNYGGPLICDGTLAGIALTGMNCSGAAGVSFYTDVYQYLEWISHPDQAATHRANAIALYATLAVAIYYAM